MKIVITKDLRLEINKDFTQGPVSSPVILNLFSGCEMKQVNNGKYPIAIFQFQKNFTMKIYKKLIILFTSELK